MLLLSLFGAREHLSTCLCRSSFWRPCRCMCNERWRRTPGEEVTNCWETLLPRLGGTVYRSRLEGSTPTAIHDMTRAFSGTGHVGRHFWPLSAPKKGSQQSKHQHRHSAVTFAPCTAAPQCNPSTTWPSSDTPSDRDRDRNAGADADADGARVETPDGRAEQHRRHAAGSVLQLRITPW